MYTINEFSKLSNTSVTTLRYYDEIDLFKPSYTDIFSGYRYYIEEQIHTISIINKLLPTCEWEKNRGAETPLFS